MAGIRKKSDKYKVGIILVFTLILVVAILFQITNKSNIFSSKTKINLISASGNGLEVGMPLKYSGFQIATVYDMSLLDNGLIEMEINIPKKYLNLFYTDTKILQISTIFGNNYLEISNLKNSKKIPIKEGNIYNLNQSNSIQQISTELLVNIGTIVENVENITTKFADPEGDLNIFIQALADSAERFSDQNGTLWYLINDPEFKNTVLNITRDTSSIFYSINDTLKIINSISEQADQASPEVISNINEFTNGLPEITTQLDLILDEINTLVKALQNVWPISNNIETSGNSSFINLE